MVLHKYTVWIKLLTLYMRQHSHVMDKVINDKELIILITQFA